MRLALIRATKLAENNVLVGVRGATGLRISPLYTSNDDLRRLLTSTDDDWGRLLDPLKADARRRRCAHQ